MTETLTGWDGREVVGTRSDGGVFAAADWRELVLHPLRQIADKGTAGSGRISAFSGDAHALVTRETGRYTAFNRSTPRTR